MKEQIVVNSEEIREEYDLLMHDYNPVVQNFSTDWKIVGDFYEQYSLYDHSLQCMSSNNLNLQ
ncbi:hypothetical protein [uncultured Rikenella sp.]|uniref:hypothetical protein n=1 Tax=uncultured Rikenella sp. TaxID=368003 RepID=UPI0026130F3C|nr:hypothetical protein [uncultured Rikenella sp.]